SLDTPRSTPASMRACRRHLRTDSTDTPSRPATRETASVSLDPPVPTASSTSLTARTLNSSGYFLGMIRSSQIEIGTKPRAVHGVVAAIGPILCPARGQRRRQRDGRDTDSVALYRRLAPSGDWRGPRSWPPAPADLFHT